MISFLVWMNLERKFQDLLMIALPGFIYLIIFVERLIYLNSFSLEWSMILLLQLFTAKCFPVTPLPFQLISLAFQHLFLDSTITRFMCHLAFILLSAWLQSIIVCRLWFKCSIYQWLYILPYWEWCKASA